MRRWLFAATALFLAATAAASAQPTVLGQFTHWTAFRAEQDGTSVCYIGSLPEKEEGDYTERGKTYVTVALRPSETATGVVTVEAGYPYKKESEVEVVIDGDKRFDLFTRNRPEDRKGDAWADDAAEDAALIEAMKAGVRMVVKGRSSRGTLTTDTYSLRGFTRAFNTIAEACSR